MLQSKWSQKGRSWDLLSSGLYERTSDILNPQDEHVRIKRMVGWFSDLLNLLVEDFERDTCCLGFMKDFHIRLY